MLQAQSMQKSETNKFLKFYSTLIAVGLIIFGVSANAQLPYSESFKNSTATGLLVSGVAGDAFLTSGSVDPVGEGYLRLTNNQNNQSGFVRSTRSFPSANGLSISFDYFIHGGTGADGLSFFLYDSSVPAFNIGAFGGSLGYAQNASLSGVSKGFIALGLDVFGNFSNPNAGRQGGPGRRLSSVLLRGDGNGMGTGTPSGSNYEYLTGISTNNTVEMAAAGAGSSFQIAGGIDGRTAPAGLAPNQAGYRRAKINMIPNIARTGFILNVWITEGNAAGAIVHHVIKNYNYIPTSGIPANLSYGFSAGTGSASNFHEIRNLEIVEPVDPSSVPVVENLNIDGIQNVELAFKISDFISKFSHPSSRALTKIKVQNLPANGLLKLNGTGITAGQEINVSDIPQMSFVPESDYIGSSKFQWNGTDGLNYAITDAYVNLKVSSITPTFPYLESFKNTTAAGLIIGGSPNLAKLTSGNGDPLGAGYLQLTTNQNNQNGYAYSNRDFPSDKGLSISFDYYGHGGSGSDGITFFLYDAAANPFSMGASGGAMGYTQNNSSAGLSKGFIGLSIDEYGNFSSPGTGRQGGPGRRSGSVTLRGDGDGNTQIPSNYEYLRHIQTNNAADMSAAGAGSPFLLSGNINGRTAGASGLDSLKTGFRRIKMDLVPNGLRTGYTVNVWIIEGNPAGAIIHHLINNFQYLPTDQIPANLRFGFSASSGAAPTSYEIRNLEILLPSNLDHKPVLNKIDKSGFEDQPLTFLLSDFSNSFFDPKGLNTLRNVEFTSLPPSNLGMLKIDGIPVTVSQLISVSDINSGKLSFIPALNYSGSIPAFKWNGHTATNKASLDEQVSLNVAALNDAPTGADNEVLIRVNHPGYVFTEADFGFSDSADNNLHTFHSVKIVNLPSSGSLKLNETAVNEGQFISADAIRGGQLKFVPGTNETGKPYTSFNFQVKDNGGQDNGGIDLDQTANIFKFNVSPLPTIELTEANPAICIGTSSAEIKFSKVTGDPLPDLYSISWDSSANSAGLIDVTNKDLPLIITIDGLSGLAAGTYNGILTVKSKTNSIISNQVPVSITIMPLLTAGISYGADSFCASGKVPVLFTGDRGGKFSSESGLKIDTLTGEINLSQSIPATYIIKYSLTNDVCSVIATANVIINALPTISAITGSSTLVAGSSSQLNSITIGGIWSSKNVQVANINSAGLVTALKEGTAEILFKVKSGNCVDSVSFQINVSRKKAGEMNKIMNENKSFLFSSDDFYNLIDSASKLNDSSKLAISKIRIESLPLNGSLKLRGGRIDAKTEILFSDIQELTYFPEASFSGDDSFRWNWSDATGKYAAEDSKVSISVISKNLVKEFYVNENELFKEKANSEGRINFVLGGTDSQGITINSLNGELTMKARDFEIPADADSNNIYDFTISSLDARGNSYSENWRITVRNVKESSILEFERPSDIQINENSKYEIQIPKLKGTIIGQVSYTLTGIDSTLFKLDQKSGILSMEGRDFDLPLDTDKDNVYEIGLKATDSDGNTASAFWKVKILEVQKMEVFSIQAVENVRLNEKTPYTSDAPKLNGKPVGKVVYSLSGIDSEFFKINESTGIISMEGRGFDSPLDKDKDNVYEIGLKATDSEKNTASVFWKVKILEVQKVEVFSIQAVDNVMLNEKTSYTSNAPKLNGKPVGKIVYSLIGKDSTLFLINESSGIVSMKGRDFNSPLDHDKDNVYEIGLNATDSDKNTASAFWKVRILEVQKMEVFSIQAVENVMLNEKTSYTSIAPKLNGKPVGKIVYSLIGKDSTLFQINESSGIVSMKGRDFGSPSDHDKNNVYEIGLIAKDSVGTMAESKWKVIIKMQPPSAVQSMLTPDFISMPINRDTEQLLTVVAKYANGESYLRGGEKVVFNKLSGSATIGSVTDHGNGTYTALINPGTVPGRSEFTATLGGKEIMNGSAITAKVIIDFTLSDDNRLKSLELSHGKISPQFKADVFEYSALVDYSVDTIKVIPLLNDQHAAIEINGIKLQKSGFQNIPLSRGKNLVSIYVTAADGISIQKYTITINRAEAVFPYLESFMGDIAEGLVFGGSPYKAKITSGTSDVTGMGYLSLTSSKPNESGFVYNSKKFPTEKGLTISFEYFSHGGSGGDGLSFFLFDASANFKIGAFGGALGYNQSSTQAGLNKGFLGLALDQYGEFSSNSLNKQGGSGRRPGSVVLRGDGNGISDLNNNYEYLTGIQTTDEVAMKLAGAGSKFPIFGNQNGRKAAGGALDEDETGYRKLKIELVPNINKTGFIINVWITEGANVKGLVHHLIKNYSYIPTEGIPLDLKYGFAANTRNMTSSYEIRNLEIGIPDADRPLSTVLTTSPLDKFIIPEATNLITPNGDGINDNWIIRNIESFGNNSVRIFNRFGQEVYRKINYTNDWDGKKGGNPLPAGTYYYIFDNSKTKQPLKGYITILE